MIFVLKGMIFLMCIFFLLVAIGGYNATFEDYKSKNKKPEYIYKGLFSTLFLTFGIIFGYQGFNIEM